MGNALVDKLSINKTPAQAFTGSRSGSTDNTNTHVPKVMIF